MADADTVVLEELLKQREQIAAIRQAQEANAQSLKEIKDLLREQNGRVRSNEKSVAATAKDTEYIRKELSELRHNTDRMMNEFITRQEFDPIKRLVYGAVGVILMAFLVAIAALVIRSGVP